MDGNRVGHIGGWTGMGANFRQKFPRFRIRAEISEMATLVFPSTLLIRPWGNIPPSCLIDARGKSW